MIEIPKPRWTAYDAMRFDVQMPEGVEMITQDRGLYVADLVHTVIGFECLLLAESGHSRPHPRPQNRLSGSFQASE